MNLNFIAQPPRFSPDSFSRDFNLFLTTSSPRSCFLAIVVVEIFLVFFAWVGREFLQRKLSQRLLAQSQSSRFQVAECVGLRATALRFGDKREDRGTEEQRLID